MTEKAQIERRRDLRISPKGTVILRAESFELRGRVANLSRYGLAAITRTTAPQRLLGANVELELRLDSQESSWLALGGKVLRIEANAIALALAIVPPAFTRLIAETVTRSLHNDRVLAIVLVDASAERRGAMAEGFRSVGCGVVEASTPLEAIVHLGHTRFEPDLIAIADSLPETISEELRRFIHTDHPQALLVTIGDAKTAPAGLAYWLSSANPSGDLAARIRNLLTAFGRS